MEIGIGLLLLLVVGALAFPVLAGRGQRRAARTAEAHSPGTAAENSLRYRTPDGQDPAVVMAALETAGYRTALEEKAGDNCLVIVRPDGREPDREEVRNLIKQADHTSFEGTELATGRVHFEDEK